MKPQPCPSKPPETRLWREKPWKNNTYYKVNRQPSGQKESYVKEWWHFSNNCIANRKI